MRGCVWVASVSEGSQSRQPGSNSQSGRVITEDLTVERISHFERSVGYYVRSRYLAGNEAAESWHSPGFGPIETHFVPLLPPAP